MLHNVDEIIYPVSADVNTLLKLIDTLDDATLNSKMPEILKSHTNSYTFTKHLAEHEIVNGGLPATIVRPSISEFIFNIYSTLLYYHCYLYYYISNNFIYLVIGAWKEPVPGWTISKNGPQGFILGASKGIVRRLPVAKHLVYDYIPVDIVVNSLIVAAYNIDRDRYNSEKRNFIHFTL